MAGQAIVVTKIKAPDLPIEEVTYPGGKTIKLNLDIGSGAWRNPKDPAGVIWVISGRGPNVNCKVIEERTGLDIGKLCAGDNKATNFSTPDFPITISKLEIGADDTAKVLESVLLKGKSGKPVTGLPFSSGSYNAEAAYDKNGAVIASNPSGMDTEALAGLPDGSFIVGEEYGPSFVEVSPDGTVNTRHVPAGVEAQLSGADYDVEGTLPAIIAKRAVNRGIEGLAVSPDGSVLCILLQSPLANPDSYTGKRSTNTRLWKIERRSGKVLGQYVYVLDKPNTFETDNKSARRKQNEVRLSEMVMIGDDRLLVVERINKTAKFYIVSLADGTPVNESFDDVETSPTLEQLSAAELAGMGFRPLKKTLILNSDAVKDMPKKIEAVAVMSPTEMIILTDSDFGVDGDDSEIRRVTFPSPVLQ